MEILDIWKYQTLGTLPAEYGEALSYGEQVAILSYELHKAMETLNGINQQLSQLGSQINKLDNVTDQIIDAIDQMGEELDNSQAKINWLEQRLNVFNTGLQEQITQLSNATASNISDIGSLNANFISLKQSVSNQLVDFNSQIIGISASLTSRFEDLEESLKNYLLDLNGYRTGNQILVKDPVSGSIMTLNQTLEKLLDYMQNFAGLTVGQYDDLEITMEEYDNLNVGYMQYNTSAKFIFFPWLLEKKIKKEMETFISAYEKKINDLYQRLLANTEGLNPLTLNYSTAIEISQQVANLTLMAPDIKSYESFGLTMDEYDSLKYTMLEYQKRFIPEVIFKELDNPSLELRTYSRSGDVYDLYYRAEIETTNLSDTMIEILKSQGFETVMLECEVVNAKPDVMFSIETDDRFIVSISFLEKRNNSYVTIHHALKEKEN